MAVITLSTTNPTLLLNANEKRTKLTIQMHPFDVNNTNDGRIHIGFGFQPVATVGHGAQGEVLIGSATIAQPSTDAPIASKYKKAVWATSSKTGQTIEVEEEVQE